MSLHPDTDPDRNIDPADTDEPTQERAPVTFRERHALKILGTIMAAMFTLVIIVQVAC